MRIQQLLTCSHYVPRSRVLISLFCAAMLLGCLSTGLHAVDVPPPTSGSGDVRPVPDPTSLTTQQLYRELAALRAIIETRLDAMDKALQLLQTRADRVPSEVDTKILAIRDLAAERFKGIDLLFEGIQLQFKERDTRVEQTARDSKTAVDAALQAAKEAVEKQNAASSQAAQKSEGAFTKSIEQLNELFRTSAKSLEDKLAIANKVSDDKLSAINERITRIESVALGQRAAGTDSKDSTMMIVAIIGAGVGVIGVVLALNASHRTNGNGNGKNV